MSHPLLDGPRGRYLCMSALAESNPDVWPAWHRASWEPGNDTLLDELANAIRASQPGTPSLPALAATVDFAMYWQPPSDQDEVLVRPIVLDALHSFADLEFPEWWTAPMAREQAVVAWRGDEHPPSVILSAAEALEQWKSRTVADELDASSRPKDPAAPWSGMWWSTPQTVATTRSAGGLPAVALALVEDGLGWKQGTVTPVVADASARVYEIASPEDWVKLVRRYPLDVPFSRRHDWFRTTGVDAPWAIPDWTLVAADFDAVHLTVMGYLLTAGRALEVDDRATVLAGWSPDWTYWLADRYSEAGAPEEWEQDESDTWHR